ncbi:hypothetical protein PsYK624_058940 [Phanerochaete sordida]|uniref:C2H2-type domain-containing protein n=1 Tax=Phanerochaete sordida TaxID=48140 RepID=A0A9P3LBS6_9APHY|nr:hypothetical protein PsYK624_058940 [Phanerochaete sordida]
MSVPTPSSSIAPPPPRGSTPPLDAPSPASDVVSNDSRPSTPLSIQLDDYGPILEREMELCTDFSCCGLTLPDMHALLDHFEEMHVVIIDADGRPVYPAPPSPTPAPSTTLQPPSLSMNSPYARYLPHLAGYSTSRRAPVASIVIDYPKPYPPATPGEYQPSVSPFADIPEPGLGLELGFPDIADPYDPFGFETQGTLPLTIEVDPPSPASPASPALSTAPSLFDTFSVSTASSPVTSAFSSPSPKLGEAASLPSPLFAPQPSAPACLPPALLETPQRPADASVSPSHSPSPEPYSILPSISRRKPYYRAELPPLSPAPATFRPYYPPPPPPQPSASPVSSTTSHAARVKAKLLGQPEQSIKISGRRKDRDREKQYKCPNAGCTKRYLNPNGLKYHIEKGTCTDQGPRPYVRKNAAPAPVAA